MAECLFKAEVASMRDKPLEVGVGQQVLRKFLVRKYPNKITNEKDLSEYSEIFPEDPEKIFVKVHFDISGHLLW